MSKIKSYLNKEKTDGCLNATIISVEDKNVKGFEIQELTVEDDSGTIQLSLFNYDTIFMEGDVIKADGLYAKEYKGNLQLNLGKKGSVELISSSGKSPVQSLEKAISLLKQVLGYFDELAENKAIMDLISKDYMNSRVIELFTEAEEFVK